MKQVKWPTTSNKIIQKIVVFCNLWMWPHGAFAGVLSNILLEIRHIHSMHGFRPHFLYTNDNQQIYCRFSKFKTSMRHVERNEMILNNSKNKLLFFWMEWRLWWFSEKRQILFLEIENISVRINTICGRVFLSI